MGKAKKSVKKSVKSVKKESKNQFKVVRIDDSRIKAKIDAGQFDDECCNVVLIDKASRTALKLELGQEVIVKKGVNKETAIVNVQFEELVGKHLATLSNKLAETLCASKDDVVTIEKVE